MSDKNLEQRTNNKFCVKIGKCASETLALLTEVYGEYAMKNSSVFERHRRFKVGREDVQDDPRNGEPKTGIPGIKMSHHVYLSQLTIPLQCTR
jgi:hypothetical protein